MFADIIIDISHEKLDKTFQYAIPEELSGELSIGMRVEVPFGKANRPMKGYVVNITDRANWDEAKIKPIIGIAKDANVIEDDLIMLAAWMKRNYGGTMNQALKTVLPIKKKEAILEKKDVTLLLDSKQAQDVYADLVGRKNHSKAKERLLLALMEDTTVAWDALTKRLNIPTSAIRDFEKAGVLRISSHRAFRKPDPSVAGIWQRHDLNKDQAAVVEQFVSDYDSGVRKPYLLYGVTGSGKTEVYLEMIDHVLAQDKQVIVLIPEISLTYQTYVRFYRRFLDDVSIMNSRLSPGERFDQFERAKKKDIKIMIGPRSALFTPFPDLGLIIIDEEHDDSYKSEQIPRYHARETALERARIAHASVVMGSATPSVESFTRARSEEYGLLRLPNRVQSRAMAHCRIVDLREELKNGNRSILSLDLQEKMEENLKKQEQTMLFINRRGMMGFVSCRACGHVIKCPHCDVSLSLHKNKKLICHYCGYEEASPTVCPECSSKYIGGFKAGTEMIEEVVQKRFPGIKTLRMDADTTKGKDGHQKILNAFANREADVLIGTQMIVKGHDFPGVTLMGILAADISLNSKDYRGAERTFQMLTQAAGRAGRGDAAGNVIIQTYQPDHYAVTAACAQTYESFYEKERAYRSVMSYPPFSHMLMIRIAGEKLSETEKATAEVFALLQSMGSDIGRILGPSDAAISKLKDIYRKVIYVRNPDYDILIDIKDRIEAALLENTIGKNVHIGFDFDPINGW